MITMRRLLVVFFILFLVSAGLFAQDGNTPHSTRPLSKWEKMFPEVKYNGKIYKTGSNWFTAAYGMGYHINSGEFNQQNISLAYHHRFRAMYFNVGWHHSSPQFILSSPRTMERLNDLHAGAGLRFEDRWYNFSFFIGPSFASSLVPVSSTESRLNYQLGAHTEIQMTFKYFYDLGIGTSIYGSFNKRYQVIGVQLHFYFSNAFVMEYK
jgi:hypothetical protein